MDERVEDQLLGGLRQLHESTEPLLIELLENPHADSVCAIDRRACSKIQQAMLLYQGRTIASAVKASGQAIEGLIRLLNMPPMDLASFAVARLPLETAAEILWALDPSITHDSRAARSLAIFHRDLEDQRKYFQSVLATGFDPNEIRSATDEIERKSALYRALVAELGEAQPIPDATRMAELAFGSSEDFRLLSAAAHGRLWFRGFVSHSQTAPAEDQASQFLYRVISVAEWFSTAAWCIVRYAGSAESADAVANTLDEAFDRIGIVHDAESRPWRAGRSS